MRQTTQQAQFIYYHLKYSKTNYSSHLSQYNKIMYRNTYLEMYKTAHNNDSSITVTFAHFTQIYNTLGCVLQDIEFQIGKLMIQTPNMNINNQANQIRPKYNEQSVQKQSTKAEQFSNQSTAKNGKAKVVFEKQMLQIKGKNFQTTKKIANISQQTESNWIPNKLIEAKPTKPRQTILKNPPNIVQQVRKPMDKQIVSTSFEDLFKHKPNTKMDLQQQSSNVGEPIVQVHENNAVVQGQNNNTFDDFFDRFFQPKSENSRGSS